MKPGILRLGNTLYLPVAQPGNATQQFSELRGESLLQGQTAKSFNVHNSMHVHDTVNMPHFVNILNSGLDLRPSTLKRTTSAAN